MNCYGVQISSKYRVNVFQKVQWDDMKTIVADSIPRHFPRHWVTLLSVEYSVRQPGSSLVWPVLASSTQHGTE